MKKQISTFILSSLFLIAAPAVQAAPVNVESIFTGGIFGNFNLQYNATAPGLKLQSVKFELQSPLFTDPTFASPGSLLPLPFLISSGAAATGFLGATGISNGANSFELLFSDFDAGEVFNFDLDVDGPCNNFFCQISGSITTGSEFAGTKVTGIFGGQGYETTSLSALFDSTGAFTAAATIQGGVAPVPEPGTMALLGTGLLALAYRARRRR